jgi:superoxide dismutase, Cu-Zn family
MMKQGLTTLLCLAGLVALGCAAHEAAAAEHGAANDHEAMWAKVNHAVAVLHPTEGNTARGVVHFHESRGKVHVAVHVEGLGAGTTHAIHVHEFGDCTSADGTSAGGHYNPEGHEHGLPDQAERHAGDLGNLTADANGVAHYEITVTNISIAGKTNPVIGRGVIVHERADTGAQPVGDAGGRIACGVIGVAKPVE